MENKICGHCKLEQSINNFYKNKQQKSGYDSWCKNCNTIKRIKYYQDNQGLIKQKRHEKYLKNKEHEDARNKIYNAKHKDKIDAYAKKYYNENKDYYKKLNHNWHKKNKEYKNTRQKYYYNQNKEKVIARQKKFYELNKEKVTKRIYNRHRERLQTDEVYKLKISIRQLIRSSFRRKNKNKCDKTINILGCSFEEFKNYIQSKFDDKMSWENYGSYWWFDHIIPLASATCEEDVIKLNHFSNFQPLYWKDNIIKGGKT